ncbi:GNAT family N-acetyltransferase [Quadrisphaera oryzae]|uniref:GNAT family N-acetyltransferase n=1 Tax=Quadrisphaera TaxID=317661 RepID=UPI001647E2CC|nr:GNAT family protein [Quadrisphaera sp. RL12-1S]MBC3760949.1 GNAT family N-acetyltransferase [Quadrisphaera sp. RL12-1S]
MPIAELWPTFGIRVSASDVQLRSPDEDQLAQLAALASTTIYDPQNRFLPRSPVAGWSGGEPTEAGRAFLRYYWASLADWSPRRWNLLLAVEVGGRCIGVQEIGAQDFAVTRTVSTGSWITPEHQRRGYGRTMRAAVLHLAFALGALRAESSAWSDNAPSLAISRALGYRENGTTVRSGDGRRHLQLNFTLERADWTPDPTTSVHGLTDAALSHLGAPRDR